MDDLASLQRHILVVNCPVMRQRISPHFKLVIIHPEPYQGGLSHNAPEMWSNVWRSLGTLTTKRQASYVDALMEMMPSLAVMDYADHEKLSGLSRYRLGFAMSKADAAMLVLMFGGDHGSL